MRSFSLGLLSSLLMYMLFSQSTYASQLTSMLESDLNSSNDVFLMAGQLSSNMMIDVSSKSSIGINTSRLTENYYFIQTQALLMPYEQFSLSAELGQMIDNSLNFQYGIGACYITESVVYGINQSHVFFEKFGYVRNLSLWVSSRENITPLNLTFRGGLMMQKYIAESGSPFKNDAIDNGFLDVALRYDLGKQWQTRFTTHLLPKGVSVKISLNYIFERKGD